MSAPRALVTRAFAIGNTAIAILVLVGVFGGLPVRWWVVDGPSVVIAALLVASAVGLAGGASWRLRLLRLSAGVCLTVGLAAIAALGVSLAFLSGTFGSTGLGGMIALTLIFVLLLPYLVAYPSAQLLWIHHTSRRAGTADDRAATGATDPP